MTCAPLLASVLICSLLLFPCPSFAKVDLQDNGDQLVLDNGLIRLVILRSNASVLSIEKDGRELLQQVERKTRGQGYVQIYPIGGYRNPTIDRVDVRRTDTLIDVGFIQDNDRLPFYMETRYVIREDVSGFYGYMVLRYDHQRYLTSYIPAHNARMAEPSRHIAPDDCAYVEQLNFCFFMDPRLFTLERVDDLRHRRLRTKADAGEMVMDATFLEPDGRIYTKYDFLFENLDHRVHGISGNGVGAWVMQGTGEHLNGGPMAQELSTEHAILLQHFCASHLGSRRVEMSPTDDGWAKLAGPFLFYFNTGDDEASLWWDARRTADQFVAEAPYEWMQHDLYARRRGTLTGKLRITDGTNPAGALVLLAQPPGESDPEWQRQGKDFFFWSRVRSDGTFTIPKVRPNTYTAYVLHDDQFGEFRFDGISVAADRTTDVGELIWTPEIMGRKVWQIGRPDRSSAEYALGADRSWGKWRAYRQFFPNDVNFTVGQSDEKRDWFYVHTVSPNAAGEAYAPTWTVRFHLDRAPSGKAALRLGVAGVRGEKAVGLSLAINGQPIGDATYASDSSPTRSASRGWYRESAFSFDAAHLKAGENVLALSLKPATVNIVESKYGKVPSGMIMYDAIRLELDEAP